MDSFAGYRFGESILNGGSHAHQPKIFTGQRDAGSSPVCNSVMPVIARWSANDRGRIQHIEGAPSAIETALLDYGWRSILAQEDVREILLAVTRSPSPPPLIVTCSLNDMPRHILLRMVRVHDANGAHLWHGTIEDIHLSRDEEMHALRVAAAASEEHYRSFVELSPQVPWTANPDGTIEEVGPRWVQLTGATQESALGGGWTSALHPDDLPEAQLVWTERLKTGNPVDLRYRVRGHGGQYRWMRARAKPRRDEAGNILRWYGTLEDVHEVALAEQALALSEERLRLAVQSARIGIWDHDVATDVGIWSDELRAMLGLSSDQPATTQLALSLVHPDDHGALQAMIAAVAAQNTPENFETTLRINRADTGELRWIRSTGWAQKYGTANSDSASISRVIVTFRDVTTERDTEERIRWAATHDPLTRLPNRALWQETLEIMARNAGTYGDRFGLLLLDIDELKRTNDTLGHDAGDALLLNFSERLLAAAPTDALVGRLGGDEFGLIAESLADRDTLEQCGAHILKMLRTPYPFKGQLLECGASIGGALFGEDGSDAQDILKAADLALYASKGAGRGRITLFKPSLKKEAEQRSTMIQLARDAIEYDRITPYYQPRIDMRTGQVLGYEALLRWCDPDRGIQLPGTIAAAFDHPEIAVTLTRTMLAAVTRDIRAWLDAGVNPGRVAINASAADFMRGNFAEEVLNALSCTGVPTSNFEIEVTETVFLGRGASHVEHALAQFARAGVRIALDDFGTGYASLSHLKQYPVDMLKIDRSFVRNLEEDKGDEAIIDAIVKLGSSLQIEVVAEGVETEGQRDILLRHGCILGQGFLLGYPQPHASLGF